MRSPRRAHPSACLLLVLGLLGVGSAGCHTQSTGSTLHGAPGRMVQPPAAAAQYQSATPAGDAISGPQSSAVQAALGRAASSYALQLAPEPRLSQLATWIAQQMQVDQRTPSQSATDLATRALGLVEPTPHFIVVSTNDATQLQERLVGELGTLFAQHAYTHYGASTLDVGGSDLVVIALSFRFVELAPLPRAIATGTPIVLKGALLQGHVQPELAVTSPDGQVERTALGTGNQLAWSVPTPTAGVYRVELLAQGPRGITVVANFPVYVDTPIPERIELAGVSSAADAEGDQPSAMLALLNAARAQAGIAPLELDPALSAIAQAHDEDMLAHGFIAHTSPTTGSAVDRVARAGVRTPLVLENIGRGYGLQEVHDGLMSSPGHRANVLNAQATHVGIAVIAQADHEATAYLVTEVFTRVTPAIDDDAAEDLLERINTQREQRRVRELDDDDTLNAIAARATTRYFTGNKIGEAEIMRQVHAELGRSSAAHSRISAVLTIVSDLEDVAKIEAVLAASTRRIGIGLSQGTRSDTFPNAICVLLLLAE